MSDIHNLIIIGSGPAGHTAAIYAARSALNPLMFEGFYAGGVAAGGQLTTTTVVENFPGFPEGIMGPALMEDMRKQTLSNDVKIISQTVDKVDLSSKPYKVYSNGVEYLTHSIIIATGATAKKLEVPGLDVYRNNGISGCAVCDGALPLFRNKVLAVIGGGDVAMEEALHLSHFGSQVLLIHRRDTFRASQAMQDKVFANPNIKIIRNSELVSCNGDGDLLNSIQIINNQTQQTQDLQVGGLFFAIGHTPNTGFLADQIDLDESGYIITYNRLVEELISGKKDDPAKLLKFKDGKKRYQTSTSVGGVFAAGDCADKVYRQAITSAGTGCMAALEAEAWLRENK